MDWFLSFSVNQLDGFQQLTAVSNEEKTNHYLFYKAILYLVFFLKVKRREVQRQIGQLLLSSQAFDMLTWPSVSVCWAEEASVDFNFLFTFRRLAPTNGLEGQN